MKTHWPIRVLTLGLFLVCASWRVEAAPPDDAAKSRAAVYQSEARTILSRRGWRITREQPGRLVAEHFIGFPIGAGTVMEDLLDTNVSGVAQLIVTFQPNTATNTACVARLKRYNFSEKKTGGGHYTTTGPYDLKAPNMLEAVSDALEKARQRMLAAHPEYAGK